MLEVEILEGGRGHASRRNGINYGIKQPLYRHLYEFDFSTETLTELEPIGDPPSRRKAFPFAVHNHSLSLPDRCLIQSNSVVVGMYVFGGWNNVDFFNDMYYLQLDCEPKKWVQVDQTGQIPPPVHDASW